MESTRLTNHFLISMPAMRDPYFAGSVTFLCDHNEHGALGLIVNRPLELDLGTMLEQLGLELARPEWARRPIIFGGPVRTERGFVLHSPPGAWTSTLAVNEEIALTTSRDVLEAIARGEGPERFLITLGCAGWGPGQLEREIAANAWLTVGAQSDILFEYPLEARMAAAMSLLGVDLANLSDDAGHA